MVQQYLEALKHSKELRTGYEELRIAYEELRQVVYKREAQIRSSERLAREKLREAIKEKILGTITSSPNGVPFRQLKADYCFLSITIIGETIYPPLSRRNLRGYIKELKLAGKIRENVEEHDGTRTLVLYPCRF